MSKCESAGQTRIAIDFETSGSYEGCACALGMTKISDGHIQDEFYTLIRPPSSRVLFSHIHGLFWKDLKAAPTFRDIWANIISFIGACDILIAHNASFDRNVLLGCCKAFHLELPSISFICTLKGARKLLPLSSKSLNCVCEYLKIPLNHHNALSDARASAIIYLHLKSMGISDKEMLIQTGYEKNGITK